jgi:hypothetical protein
MQIINTTHCKQVRGGLLMLLGTLGGLWGPAYALWRYYHPRAPRVKPAYCATLP